MDSTEDLSQFDMFPGGHVKPEVYLTKPCSLNDLCARIMNVISAIIQTQLQNMLGELQNHVMLCIQKDSGYVEN